jgi:hypothetical protein
VSGVLSIKQTHDFLRNRNPLDSDTVSLIDPLKEIEQRYNDIKKEMHMMKRRELERINKEFLLNKYERRFNITQDVIVSIIVGEDHVNSEMGRQQRDQKVKVFNFRYFMKSYYYVGTLIYMDRIGIKLL